MRGDRLRCPVCNGLYAIRKTGLLARHDYDGRPCAGSDRPEAEVRHPLPLTEVLKDETPHPETGEVDAGVSAVFARYPGDTWREQPLRDVVATIVGDA